MKNDTPIIIRSTFASRVAMVLASLLLAPTTQGANIWDGGSFDPGDNNWNTATNWDDNVVPTFPAALTFGGTNRLAASNDLADVTVNGITFAAGAGAFALGGNPITLGGNISVLAGGSTTNDQTINLPLTLNASRTLTAAPAGGYYLLNKGALVINGEISGPYGLTATGKNYVQLNGANSYTGNTVITGGDASFSIGNANAFGTGKLIVGASPGESQMWIQSVGNLTVTNAIEIRTGRFVTAGYTVAGKAAGNLTLSGDILLNQGGGGDFYCQRPLTLSGPVSGGSTYGLRLAAGAISLQGVNTFTNHVRTTGSGITFNINSDAALGHTNNSFLATFSSTLQTAASTAITLSPSRTVNISSTNTVTFDVPSGSALTIPGLITNSGAIIKANAGTLTLSGAVANGGGITLNAGKLALSGTNTYGNGTFLKGGILNITGDAALGAEYNPVSFTTSATLQAGATNVSIAASRAINLTNAATYTATFDVPTNFTLAVAGPIKSSVSTNGALTKTSPGKLILTGGSDGMAMKAMNILEGTLSIQGGTWLVAPAATDDSTVFNVTGGATYEQTGGTNTIPYYSCISQQYTGGATTNLTSIGILSGGTLNGYELMIGRRNSAVMTISGDALLNLTTFKLGELTGFTTVCNLDGGVVACNYIASRGTNSTLTTSILNLNGGTIRAKSAANIIGASGSGTTSYLTTVNVKSGGAFIDSQSFAVAIPQILNHDPELGTAPDGGLTKRGTGALTLATNNTYTGVTSIEGGTLVLGRDNTLPPSNTVMVSANAMFNVNAKAQTLAGIGGGGTVTNLGALTVSGTVAPGDAGAFGTLTLAAAPAALGGILAVNVSTNGACDRLHVRGNLNLSALSLSVEDTAQFKKFKKYTIATCTGTLGIPFGSVGSLPQRWAVKYDTVNKTASLTYDFGTLINVR